MQRTLRFKTSFFDTALLRAGETISAPLNFFVPDSSPTPTSPGVAAVPEADLVEWVLRPERRHLLLTELGCPLDSAVYTQVQEPIVEDRRRRPGDVDIMIVPRLASQTIAIEVKRVKVLVDYDHLGDKLGKVEQVEKRGIQQANALLEMGFHQVYLAILIAADGRRREGVNVFYQGPDARTMDRIYDIRFSESLHRDVGVLYIEVTQPTMKSYQQMAGIGVCVDRAAQQREQRDGLRRRIEDFQRCSG